LTGRGATLWQALQTGASTAKQLAFKLGLVADNLTGSTPALRDALIAPLRRLQSLAGDGTPDWPALLYAARPGPPDATHPNRLLQGVSLLSARDLPWRGARHLIVSGFAAGNYPRPAAASPFFLDSESALIRRQLGLNLPGRSSALARSLALFQRQIGAASESVTFLSARMDGAGQPLALPMTFSLIAARLEGGETALRHDLAATPAAEWPVAHTPVPPAAPPPASPEALCLNRDLLRLRLDTAGLALPQSPSRLETLMVSPLAWALTEMEATDLPWAPEALTLQLKGILAHHVLEHAFPPGALPDPGTLDETAALHIAQGIRRHAAFLAAPQWQLERETLLREVLRSVRLWHEMLSDEGAEVMLNEVRLQGEAHGIFLKGRADAVLRLPDGQILIVDHKKGSATNRRARMRAGWDLQIGLYRAMLLRPIRVEGDGLDPVIRQNPATAYHTLNDGTLLHSGLHARTHGSPRVEAVAGDICDHAVQLMQHHLAEVATGRITLNTLSHEDFFLKQAHLTPYALDLSPLIRRFMRPEVEEAE
jgi:RecB family exonuclease